MNQSPESSRFIIEINEITIRRLERENKALRQVVKERNQALRNWRIKWHDVEKSQEKVQKDLFPNIKCEHTAKMDCVTFSEAESLSRNQF